jgi:AcrR family transcriptional regulator
MNVAVLAESELGSEAQRERRKRILDATLAIASKGGYEAVQMRAVAERADVAVGTLYRYFPSKVHLLVSALGREFERIDAKTDRAVLAAGATPYQRLNIMVGKLNRAMQRNPLLTEAMTRAFVFADASARSTTSAS